jgi:hypothetical protein
MDRIESPKTSRLERRRGRQDPSVDVEEIEAS